ncbi:hypothetical protein [uncultured Rhodospira sp.]|uniref:hypothetical protein n=1 Tax=uncultured Rhodospira sp. TaxID=1936189 RepID=UPI0026059602|nr:hypothetical protein [uncultured Rhodospira sp.]
MINLKRNVIQIDHDLPGPTVSGRWGTREEAVAHWRDMLRLCPNDNMGIRHVLAPKLLHLNLFEAVRELLDEYEEPDPAKTGAEWGDTDALLKYKQGGAKSGAGKALAAAIKNNPHVPAYLLGEKRLPKQPPPHYALGSKDEAVLYVLSSGETWTSTKGALAWLSETAKNTL